jgi:hypothetical protein
MIRRSSWILAVGLMATLAALAPSTAQARWKILSETAINDRQLCRDGLRYTWIAFQSDTPYPSTPPAGTPASIGPVDLTVDAAPHGSQDFDWPSDAIVVGHDSFDAAYKATAQTINGTTSYYDYLHKSVLPFTQTVPQGFAVRYVAIPPGSTADDVSHPVVDPVPTCFLWGPIDFMPGSSTNSIHPTGTGGVKVALFSGPGFDATRVTGVTFGPAGAAPTGRSNVDKNGDGRLDAVFSFPIRSLGITCSTTQVTLSAVSDGRRFYEQDVVHPVC